MDMCRAIFKADRRILGYIISFLLPLSCLWLANDVRAAPGVDGARIINAANTVINAYTPLAVAATVGATRSV